MTNLEKAVWGAAYHFDFQRRCQDTPQEGSSPLRGLLSEEDTFKAVQAAIDYADSTVWYLREHAKKKGFLHSEEAFESERTGN